MITGKLTTDWRGKAVAEAESHAARKGLEHTAAEMVAPAMARTPVVTATAQGSIGFRPATQRGSRWVVLFGSFNVGYFVWLEIGAKGRPALRMLQTAVDEQWPKLAANIKRYRTSG